MGLILKTEMVQTSLLAKANKPIKIERGQWGEVGGEVGKGVNCIFREDIYEIGNRYTKDAQRANEEMQTKTHNETSPHLSMA